MLRSLPEQINFISMNPRTHCFLLAHLNRQEANFKWSGPHSTAVYVREGGRETQRDREREEKGGERARDQHIRSPKGSREGKDAADEEQRGIHEERERPACSSDWGWGAEREGEQLKLM